MNIITRKMILSLSNFIVAITIFRVICVMKSMGVAIILFGRGNILIKKQSYVALVMKKSSFMTI
ncbi:MAG TPA: hypothetical protein VK091_07405 [Virgibacillus sp.]|nr:hypothetical protein [Virgibacillus sp.]